MKAIAVLVGAFLILVVGSLMPRAFAEPLLAERDGSVMQAFVGRQVKVYFQSEKTAVLGTENAKYWDSCDGKLKGFDTLYLRVVLNDGDELMVPTACVAYVHLAKASAPAMP